MTWIPPRLRPLIGADLDSVTQESIAGLIGTAESQDLEFKTLPWEATSGGRKECAYDIADKANGGGGLIVIGVAEDESSVAKSLAPFTQEGRDLGQWVHQVIAERVSPPVVVSQRTIDCGSGTGLHIVSARPSINTPHAVSVGDGALRFPVRSGTSRRWLAEIEVAEWYQRRMSAVAQRDVRIAELISDARVAVPSRQAAWGWLIVAAMPEYAGRLDMRSGLALEWQQWMTAALGEFPNPRARWGSRLNAQPAFRSVEVFDERTDTGAPFYATAGKLGLDGAGYMIFGYPPPSEGKEAFIPDEWLTSDLIAGTTILCRHAALAGASGAVDIVAEAAADTSVQRLAVGQTRGLTHGILRGSHPISGRTGQARHTAPLDSIAAPGPGVIAVTRLLLGDLIAAFGLAEPRQITAEGQLVKDRWDAATQQAVENWASEANVDVLDSSPSP